MLGSYLYSFTNLRQIHQIRLLLERYLAKIICPHNEITACGNFYINKEENLYISALAFVFREFRKHFYNKELNIVK